MFLLSFLNGNSDLCRLALRHGACMGAINNLGQSVFNIDTPTKQLLFGLLGLFLYYKFKKKKFAFV